MTSVSTTLSKKSTGSATGKVILMGEHSVVYEEPAIAIPFSGVQVETSVQAASSGIWLDCAFYQGLAKDMPEILDSLKMTIAKTLTLILPDPAVDPAISLTIHSTIPAERGMGSSAAVAVSVVRALFSYYERDLDATTLWDLVQASEKIAHGNPSGIDTATTSSNHPIYYIKNQELKPFTVAMDAILVVADTGETGHTLEAVQEVARLVDTSQTAAAHLYQQAIRELGHLARTAKTALTTNQPDLLGSLMNQAHHLLRRLHVSNASLDRLVHVAQEAGALGAKLTGGGQGGCMIALARNVDQAITISQALSNAGAIQTWYHDLGGNQRGSSN